LNTKI